MRETTKTLKGAIGEYTIDVEKKSVNARGESLYINANRENLEKLIVELLEIEEMLR